MATTTRSSVVGDVRRPQILAAAIEVIALDGLAKASLSRIAERAGLSSAGLITYHFTDRQRLLDALLADVMTRLDEAVRAAVDAADGPAAALSAYIEGMVGFQDEHRNDVSAVWQVVWSRMSMTPPDPATGVAAPAMAKDPRLVVIRQILEAGVRDGSFRGDLDVEVVARTVNSAVLGFLDLVSSGTEVDADAFAAEQQRIFALATSA